MAEKNTLARPYAKAIFEIAKEQANFDQWYVMLESLTEVATDSRVQSILQDYTISPNDMAQFFIEVCGKALDEQGKNLVQVLASYRRLRILPEILRLFEGYRAKALSIMKAECVTAVALSDVEKEAFISFLKQKFNKQEIEMNCRVEKKLMGGFVIRSGDTVIDGSLRSQLEELKAAMGG